MKTISTLQTIKSKTAACGTRSMHSVVMLRGGDMDRPDSKVFLKLREAKALTIDEGHSVIEYIKYLENGGDITQLQQEIKDAKILLWAAIKSNGDKLHINDIHIARWDRNSKLHRYDDAANNQVVFTAT